MNNSWILAARPKTLVASVLPVFTGFILALEDTKNASFFVGFLCLLYCLLIQVATNFANDYFDFKKGADSDRNFGPNRMVRDGRICPKAMITAAWVLIALSFILGIYIMELVNGHRLLLVIGFLSGVFAFAYTGGPYPLAYNALGDLFVIVFFGFVAVMITHYVAVLSGGVEWQPNWYVPLGVGFVINNLLVVNNYRDFDEDRKSGKKTLVVIFGKKAGLVLFLVGVLVSTLLTPFLAPSTWPTIFLLPIGFYSLIRLPKALNRRDYDKILAHTSLTVVGYTVCLFLGYFI